MVSFLILTATDLFCWHTFYNLTLCLPRFSITGGYWIIYTQILDSLRILLHCWGRGWINWFFQLRQATTHNSPQHHRNIKERGYKINIRTTKKKSLFNTWECKMVQTMVIRKNIHGLKMWTLYIYIIPIQTCAPICIFCLLFVLYLPPQCNTKWDIHIYTHTLLV